MHLEGSCHCQAVRFSLEPDHPCPFNLAAWHERLGLAAKD